MKLPIQNVVFPTALYSMKNGQLPEDILREVAPQGKLEKTAARAWLALVAVAKESGWDLTYTYGGMFRSYMSQVDLFKRRYVPTFNPVKCSATGSRTWEGQKYWKLRGVAAAATPGTSNHGWGLAIDTALGSHPTVARSIAPALGWMVENAPKFGFSWELQSEPWHIRYVAGDRIPQAVLDFEAGVKADPVSVAVETFVRPTCRRGMRGSDAVREMQERLTKAGWTTTADGWYGAKTEKSLKAFQRSAGTVADGVCGPITWRKLIEATSG